MNQPGTAPAAMRVAPPSDVSGDALRAERILQRVSDAYVVLDRDCRFVTVNAAAERSMRRSRAELIGRSHWEIFPRAEELEVGRAFRRALDTGVDQHFRQSYHGDGFDVDLEIDAYRTEEGGLAVFWRDITARVRAEEATLASEARLRASEERYLLAARATNHAIWDWELDSDLMTWSEGLSTIFGYSMLELVGTGTAWTAAIHPEDRDAFRRGVRQLVGGEHGLPAWGFAHRFRRRDGSYAFVVNRAAVSRDAGGRARRIVGAMEDVSARRELEERLRQAQKMEAVGQLAGGIAHDFNNLLTVITGNLELVESDLAADHPLRPELHEISTAAERARTLVRQLLTFSRKQVVHPRPVRVGEIVLDTERLLRRVIGEEITLTVAVHDQGALVEADPGQLEQVVMNLVVNARDALLTPLHGHRGTGGTLQIETRVVTLAPEETVHWPGIEAGEYVQLAVRDSGHGMDEETRERVFEPFFTTKGVGAGTGLGLATVFGIVQQARGAIRVDSVRGAGTTFSVRLPVARRRDAMPTPALPTRVGAPPSATLLVVEDEAPLRAMLRRLLERTGYAVLDARDGAEALTLWHRHHQLVGAVITDIRMPEMGGYELVAALHAERPGLPVVFLSGYSDQLPSGPLAPHERFVEKPFTTDRLLQALEAVLTTTLA